MQFVLDILRRSRIKQKYIDTLSTPASAAYFETAFTDPSYDDTNNYLFLRSLGTLELYKTIVWYIVKKHPYVNQKTLTQININILSDFQIGEFVNTLGISAHIFCDEKKAKTVKMSQMVFEAIVGAAAFLLNHHYKFGIGNLVADKIYTYVLDQLEINVNEELLSDPKTKLKELYFDYNISTQKLQCEDVRQEDGSFYIELFNVGIYTGKREKIGEGSGETKIKGEKNASVQALLYLKRKGLLVEKGKSTGKKDQSVEGPVHAGKPVDQFQVFILNLIRQRVPLVSDLKLDKNEMSQFVTSFTSPDVNNEKNYELYETLGDKLLNNCVLWYISNRFPQLNVPDAMDLMTKIKIRIIQTNWLGGLSDSLGFYDYIHCLRNLGENARLKVLEDVFESFFAVLNMIVDNQYKKGMGMVVCYRFIASLLDEKDISISYDFLVDPKTQLKEVFDLHKTIRIKYTATRVTVGMNEMYTSTLLESKLVGKTPLGDDMFSTLRKILTGKEGYTEKEAEQNVASEAIRYYKNLGISKPIPKEYLKFCM